METAELRNFLEFYYTSSMDEDEDITEINEELERAEIEKEVSMQEALDLIRNAELEIQNEKGKEFTSNCTL